jgi:hypothetical protein
VEYENKSDTSGHNDDWSYFKITQQHIGKAQNYGIAKNSLIGHRAHSMENVNIKIQNVFHG